MTPPRTFITWQPVLTDHQAFTLEQLALQAGVPVVAFVSRAEDETRRSQGWRDTQVAAIDRRVLPRRGTVRFCVQQLMANRNEVHLFGSPFQDFSLMVCLVVAGWLGIETYLISEPYSPVAHGYLSDARPLMARWKARARPLAYRAYALALRRGISGIFAISRLAIAQYRAAGVESSKLFPFGYFVPQAAAAAGADVAADAAQLKLVFVGSLIATKGLDLLIAAVDAARAGGAAVTLDVFGPGDPTAYAFREGVTRYCGRIPFGETQTVVSGYDALVLPSRYDGWGVVVNEALCAGVPVICSDRVGAGVLVEKFGAGAIFDGARDEALRDLLVALAQHRERIRDMRQHTADAASAIQPEVAAAYLLSVIRAPRDAKARVPSPWYGGSP
jgi:glycosyltransferase involved in cell wall biosynthesis